MRIARREPWTIHVKQASAASDKVTVVVTDSFFRGALNETVAFRHTTTLNGRTWYEPWTWHHGMGLRRAVNKAFRKVDELCEVEARAKRAMDVAREIADTRQETERAMEEVERMLSVSGA